jgi:3-phenylpropionate/trans-cinnamate dioxygenase ferredoxin subunit
VEGHTVALFNVGGTLYALDDECPHAEGGRLSCGTMNDTSVWCPLHGASFALATGRTIEPPEGEAMQPPVNRGVHTYRVRVQRGDVYVEL